ncbi:MAG TPA: IS110 family transposase, partial [Longimicrobiales bacterium]|nr:IS110 family transposase [Longimicrobiales bacterium]
MRISIGIDVAKEEHWATAITDLGDVLLDRRVLNTPPEVAELLSDLEALGGARTVGVDVLGGIASLLCAMLLEAGERLVHVPGLAVNRGREGTPGGENKSDPRDARVIADQVRTRRELRAVEPEHAASVELRLLVSRRRELVKDQTRRLARLRELLVSIHPGLERRLDVTNKGDLFLLTRHITPGEIRKAGLARLTRFLRTCQHLRKPELLATRALEAAREQTFALPGERLTAQFCRELAEDALKARERLASIDRQLEELVQ